MRALVLLLLTACGSPTPAVDLPTQWDHVEGAIGGGTVEKVDETQVQVKYIDPPRGLIDTWTAAIESGGYTVGEPKGLPGLMSYPVTKGDEKLELIVSQRGSRADVLLTK